MYMVHKYVFILQYIGRRVCLLEQNPKSILEQYNNNYVYYYYIIICIYNEIQQNKKFYSNNNIRTSLINCYYF